MGDARGGRVHGARGRARDLLGSCLSRWCRQPLPNRAAARASAAPCEPGGRTGRRGTRGTVYRQGGPLGLAVELGFRHPGDLSTTRTGSGSTMSGSRSGEPSTEGGKRIAGMQRTREAVLSGWRPRSSAQRLARDASAQGLPERADAEAENRLAGRAQTWLGQEGWCEWGRHTASQTPAPAGRTAPTARQRRER